MHEDGHNIVYSNKKSKKKNRKKNSTIQKFNNKRMAY